MTASQRSVIVYKLAEREVLQKLAELQGCPYPGSQEKNDQMQSTQSPG